MQTGFSAALATHVATLFHELQCPFWMQDDIPLDVEYLNKNGLAGRDPVWRKLVDELASPLDLA